MILWFKTANGAPGPERRRYVGDCNGKRKEKSERKMNGKNEDKPTNTIERAKHQRSEAVRSPPEPMPKFRLA